jgi:lipopolysaccharide export LptBFGC system permease protein LptF
MRQILSPFLCLAGSLSVAWFFALQPFSAYLNHEIQIKEQHYFGMPITSSTRTNLWLYQRPSPSQGILLHVGHMQDSICSDVSIYLFLQNGVLTEKIFAKTLYFTPGAWILSQGTIFKMNNLEYQTFTERRFENTLDANKILLSLAPPKDIGMYDLFSIMKVRRKNHLYEEGHTLALHTLGAKSVLIFFMVLVAGCFQTKHSRLKKSISIAKTLLCCLFLHFFMDIFHSLGKQGIILPFWASWVPIFLTGACAFACLSWKGER